MAIAGYNILLNRVYKTYGVRVADVFGAFHTSDFGQQVTVPGFGTPPAQRRRDLPVDLGVRGTPARAERARQPGRLPGDSPARSCDADGAR